jgi:DNA polymerase
MVSQRREAEARAARSVVQTLESLELAGVTHLGKRHGQPAMAQGAKSLPPERPQPVPPASPPVLAAPPAAPPQPQSAPASAASRQHRLEIIRQEVAVCTRCPHLAAARTNTVFGSGDPHARLCFCGEAPGADEDRQGVPFVGRAGQLLTKIIEACKLKRDEVYILNPIKCRPPDNRAPLPDELDNCREFIERQLEVLQPEFICCLGATAARALLATDRSIGKLRGQFFDYRGSQVICTYHPSYLLRNPAAKKDVWEDMKMLMRKMGIEPD